MRIRHILQALLLTAIAAANAAPSANCLSKDSPPASPNEYAVKVTNNCGECAKVVWNVFVNGERALFFPGDQTEQKWGAGESKTWRWTMNMFGTWEWRATAVQACS